MVFCNKTSDCIYSTNFKGHNPYFNRWFSAIWHNRIYKRKYRLVTILILIDGFLQFIGGKMKNNLFEMSQSLF